MSINASPTPSNSRQGVSSSGRSGYPPIGEKNKWDRLKEFVTNLKSAIFSSRTSTPSPRTPVYSKGFENSSENSGVFSRLCKLVKRIFRNTPSPNGQKDNLMKHPEDASFLVLVSDGLPKIGSLVQVCSNAAVANTNSGKALQNGVAVGQECPGELPPPLLNPDDLQSDGPAIETTLINLAPSVSSVPIKSENTGDENAKKAHAKHQTCFVAEDNGDGDDEEEVKRRRDARECDDQCDQSSQKLWRDWLRSPIAPLSPRKREEARVFSQLSLVMQSLKDQEVLKAHLDELQKQVTSLKWELGAARDANKLYQQQRKIAEQIACAKQKQVVSLQQQNVQKEKRAELSTFKPAQGFNKAKILKYTMGAVMGAVGLGLVLSNLYNRSRSITGVTATEKAQGVMRDARHLVHMVGNAVGESLPGNPLTTHPRVGEKLGEVGRDLFELGSMIIRAASPEVVTATIVPAVGLVASSVLRKESPMPDFVMMGADNKQAL